MTSLKKYEIVCKRLKESGNVKNIIDEYDKVGLEYWVGMMWVMCQSNTIPFVIGYGLCPAHGTNAPLFESEPGAFFCIKCLQTLYFEMRRYLNGKEELTKSKDEKLKEKMSRFGQVLNIPN